MARVDAATGLKAAYSFDTLVVGANNHVAAAACREVVKSPGEMYNPLVIYGPAGVGKTHLMQAVAHEMLAEDPKRMVKYISAERFMNEIVTAIADDRIVDLRRAYSQLDLLIIDDVQYLVESKIAQEELFHIFNNMHQENRQVILAADRTPNQLSSLSKGIRSRLEWGLATDVQPPDESTRLEILRRKQTAQGMTMADEMLIPVARALHSNVRELEGFLKRMHAYVNLSHQKLSMDLVRAVVRELAPDGGPDVAANGATLNNESPGLPPAPGLAPELKRVLSSENGHHNGNGATNGNGRKHAEPAPEPDIEKEPEPPSRAEAARKASASAEAAASSIGEFLKTAAVDAPSSPAVEPPAVPAPAPEPAKSVPKPESSAKAAPPPPPAPPPPVEKIAPVADKPAPVVEKPAAVEAPPAIEPVPVEADDGDAVPAGHKEVTAVFFFPEGKNEALETVHKKFQDVIKKHKLKFRLKRVHDEAFAFKGKINYAAMAEVCQKKKVPVAIVVGPPPESLVPEQDFHDPLTVALDAHGVSLQLVSWSEINKDYRYLNLALDIALVKSR